MSFLKKIFSFPILFLLIIQNSDALMSIKPSQGFILHKNLCRFKEVNLIPKYNKNNIVNGFFSTEQLQDSQKKKTVRILSIDGGGIRAIIPLYILKEIETRTKKPIVQLFDIIAGTSSGGMIALGLNVPKKTFDQYYNNQEKIIDSNNQNAILEPIKEHKQPQGMGIAAYSSSDILRIYEERAESIFGGRWEDLLSKMFINRIKDMFRPRHSINNLRTTLSSYFKDIKLSESLSTVLVTAYEIQRGESFLFNSYDARRNLQAIPRDFYMRDAALSTSAAPTYFSPAKITDVKNEEVYHLVDGGIVANNPTLRAYTQARRIFPDADDFYIVSLGTGNATGHYIDYEKINNRGLLKWAPYITPMLMHATGDAVLQQIDDILHEAKNNPSWPLHPRYHRLDIPIDNELLPLDRIDQKHIGKLKIKGSTIVSNHNMTLNSIITELQTKRPYARGLDGNILLPGDLGGVNNCGKNSV